MSELDDLFADDGGEDSGTDGAPPQDPSKTGAPAKSTDKRISDLQSKADQETARANKAEKELARIRAAAAGAEEGNAPVKLTGADAQSVSIMLDMSRSFTLQTNPKLAEYGITASDLEGTTPAQIAASGAALVARFEKIETQARNKVLADHGLAPEIATGGGSNPSRDYSQMSKEDFDKLLEQTLRGG